MELFPNAKRGCRRPTENHKTHCRSCNSALCADSCPAGIQRPSGGMKALHCPSTLQPALIVFIDSENLNLNRLSSLFGCTKATSLLVVLGSVLSYFHPLCTVADKHESRDRRKRAEISQRMIRLSISLLLSLRMKDLMLDDSSLYRPFPLLMPSI